ncbi:MAG: BTAD domain-containing putative transcriptional regulator [Candidatus Contendobacter sp.]|nr:BTAD domain-containing putative transcriptional regulator [Candidatus Contendobacter sp.]MDG4559205.1 BTAD domain-containing putative transcriptional regulator [Candidatus Contendobacter sp.]
MPRKLGRGDRGETTQQNRAARVRPVSAPMPAKLAPPRLHDIAERERLFSLLDERCQYPLVWIFGPPGTGKTTLVASYLHARKLPGIWYQVDAGDADPATLFDYLRQTLPSSRQARLPLFTPEYLPDLPGFARRFFRELFARLPRPAALVLDNFHEAAAATPFLAVWREAAAQIPESVNLLMIGRLEPPAEYARLQISELLTVLDPQDLRLTPEETRTIVALRGHLPETAARALHERSKGWVAGLTLLLEHVRKTGIPSDATEQASPQALFDYFATEIFASATDDFRRIWLRTAYLPRFTAPTARALSGRENADRLLDALHRQGYFVDRRSASATVYQYHALFQAFLRHRVEQDYPTLERRELVRASARALDAQGDSEAAFGLFAEVADWDAAVGSILARAAELFGQGRWRTLQGWIDALPRATVETIPWLLFWSGACQAQTAPGTGRATLERAHDRFRATDDELGQALSACAILESHYLEWGDFANRDRWIDVLERVLTRHPMLPSPSTELRVWSTLLLALAYLKPQHPLAPTCAERVWRLCRLELPAGERLMAANWLLLYLVMMEDTEQMRAAALEFAPLTRSADITPLQRVGWNWSHALYLMCLADFGRCRHDLVEARSLAATAGLDYLVGVSSLLEVWTSLTEGHLVTASARLDELAAEIDRARPNDVALYHFLRSWLALLREHPRTALEHARKSAEIIRQRPHAGPSVSSLGAYSHALAECGETARGVAVAQEALSWVKTPSNSMLCFNALLFAADALRQHGLHEQCSTMLGEAFATGRRGGFLNCMLWLPKMMARLCADALAASIEPEYVESLVRQRGLLAPSADVERWPWPVRVYTLGRFALVLDGKPLKATGKPRHRPLELLKVLIALGGREVHGEALIEALWPGASELGAQKTLQITVRRLRELLGNAESLRVQDGKLTLDASRCWVDVWALERTLNRAKDALARGVWDGAGQSALAEAQRLYQGPFLVGEPDRPWLIGRRERLRERLLRALSNAGQQLEQARRFAEAVALYEQAVDVEPLAEEIYRRLMVCLSAQGQRAEAMEVYRRCRRHLSIVLGIPPAAATEALYRSLASGK